MTRWPSPFKKRLIHGRFIPTSITIKAVRYVPLSSLEKWDTQSGIKSQRLAKLIPGPILVRSPSLVQHTATDSCWGAGINRALDFEEEGEA